jgi:hypothetical protein
MVLPIVNQQMNLHHLVQNGAHQSLYKRIYDAVIDFFTTIANQIKIFIDACWNSMKDFLQIYNPESIQQDILNDENAKPTQTEFLEASIELFRAELQKQEEANIAKIKAEFGLNDQQIKDLKIHEDQLPLKKFDEEYESFYGGFLFSTALAASKAYLISNISTDIEFFTQTDKVPGDYIEPIYMDGELIHGGGQQVISQKINHADTLKKLKSDFKTLPEREQSVIRKMTNCERINEWPLSEKGKMIARELARISNKISQGNPKFFATLQAVHEKKFPPQINPAV